MDTSEKYEAIHRSRPKLKFCERFDETSNIWNFNVHNHPYIELMYFLEGTASVDLDNVQLSVSLYDTVVYPANRMHHEARSPELKREIICLWVDIPDLILDEPLQIQDHDNCLRSLFLCIMEEKRNNQQTPHLMEYYLKTLLTLVVRFACEDSQWQHLQRAMQYIHANYTDQIMLDKLARLEYISKSYLSRQFKKLTGMTVIEYVNHLRVTMAKHLLVTTERSITNIGYQVGYESPKYFYRVFRSVCGQSPATFRRTYRRKTQVPS